MPQYLTMKVQNIPNKGQIFEKNELVLQDTKAFNGKTKQYNRKKK